MTLQPESRMPLDVMMPVREVVVPATSATPEHAALSALTHWYQGALEGVAVYDGVCDGVPDAEGVCESDTSGSFVGVVEKDVEPVVVAVFETDADVVRVSDDEPVLVDVREAEAVDEPVLDDDEVAEEEEVAESVELDEDVLVDVDVTDWVVELVDVDVEVCERQGQHVPQRSIHSKSASLRLTAVRDCVELPVAVSEDVPVAVPEEEEVEVAEDVCVADDVDEDVDEAVPVDVLVAEEEGVPTTSYAMLKAGMPLE